MSIDNNLWVEFSGDEKTLDKLEKLFKDKNSQSEKLDNLPNWWLIESIQHNEKILRTKNNLKIYLYWRNGWLPAYEVLRLQKHTKTKTTIWFLPEVDWVDSIWKYEVKDNNVLISDYQANVSKDEEGELDDDEMEQWYKLWSDGNLETLVKKSKLKRQGFWTEKGNQLPTRYLTGLTIDDLKCIYTMDFAEKLLNSNSEKEDDKILTETLNQELKKVYQRASNLYKKIQDWTGLKKLDGSYWELKELKQDEESIKYLDLDDNFLKVADNLDYWSLWNQRQLLTSYILGYWNLELCELVKLAKTKDNEKEHLEKLEKEDRLEANNINEFIYEMYKPVKCIMSSYLYLKSWESDWHHVKNYLTSKDCKWGSEFLKLQQEIFENCYIPELTKEELKDFWDNNNNSCETLEVEK